MIWSSHTARHRWLLVTVSTLLVAATLSAQSSPDATETVPTADSGWIALFDGSNLDAWRGYQNEERSPGWIVEDGLLYRKSGGGDLVTRQSFGDFELAFEWKVAKGANSGIIYRSRLGDGAPYMSGPEYQILDSAHQDGGDLTTSAGALYALYPTTADAMKPAGEWNTGRIVVRGNHIEHWLNGKRVVDCEMWNDDWNQRHDKSKFKGWEQFARTAKGHISLQDHGDPVWFRDVRIRELDSE